jgi:cysteinyl-tRNA synthetase
MVNCWLHNELVMVEGKKPIMHSDEEVFTLRHILERGYEGRVVRYWLLSRHYRKPMYFSWDKLEIAKQTVDHLDKFVHKLHACPPAVQNPDIDQVVYDLKHKFVESLDDDLNIARALAALFEFTNKMNRIMDKEGLSPEDKEKAEDALKNINSVLGVLDLERPRADERIEDLIRKRDEARRAKDWELADRIRRELGDMGIELIDTKQGTTWKKRKGLGVA